MPPSGRRASTITASNRAPGNVKGKNSGTNRSFRYNEGAKWTVTEYKPPRRISDEEIAAARKMFFELDRDMSGSIDAEEIAFMLRSMGQNPTDEEVHALIASVDGEGGEESDGKIQLREFIKLYTEGLDTKNKGSKKDVEDVFRAIDANSTGEVTASSTEPVKEAVAKAQLTELLSSSYDLDIDVDDLFNGKGDQVSKDEMTSFLLGSDAR